MRLVAQQIQHRADHGVQGDGRRLQIVARLGQDAGQFLDALERLGQGWTYRLAVSAQASLRRDPEAVGDLLLRSASTEAISVPLKSVANIYLTDDRATISHDGGFRRQVVRCANKLLLAGRTASSR